MDNEVSTIDSLSVVATWARQTRTSDYVVFWQSGDFCSATLVVAGSEWEAVEALRSQYSSSVHKVFDAIEVFEHPKPLLSARAVLGNADLRVVRGIDTARPMLDKSKRILPAVKPGDPGWHAVKAFNNRVVRGVFLSNTRL